MDAFKRSLGIGTSQSSGATRTAMDESNVVRSESIFFARFGKLTFLSPKPAIT